MAGKQRALGTPIDEVHFIDYEESSGQYTDSKTGNKLEIPKDHPRLFVSISGYPTLSLSTDYRLHVQLSYPAEHSSLPITFSESKTPIGGTAGIECQYKFLKDGTVAPEFEIELKPGDRRPRQVSVENGFSTIYPGEKIETDVMIDVARTYGLETGKQYQLQLPWGHIDWWGYGNVEAYSGVQVGILERGKHPPIIIPRSNTIDVMVLE